MLSLGTGSVLGSPNRTEKGGNGGFWGMNHPQTALLGVAWGRRMAKLPHCQGFLTWLERPRELIKTSPVSKPKAEKTSPVFKTCEVSQAKSICTIRAWPCMPPCPHFRRADLPSCW
jgi:hypothetical protein